MHVKYVFGLRGADGESMQLLELSPETTVFHLLRRLGLAGLEILIAVNGTTAKESMVLHDGDRLLLIPAIQGGAS